MHSGAGKLDRSYDSREEAIRLKCKKGALSAMKYSSASHIALMQHLLEPLSKGGKVGLVVEIVLS